MAPLGVCTVTCAPAVKAAIFLLRTADKSRIDTALSVISHMRVQAAPALLPLLPMTAFLHSMMVQERRGMLKLWNLALVVAAFGLAVFGTFNVRSGLVDSVHSFAQSNIGAYFLILVAGVLVTSIVPPWSRTIR